MTNQPTIPLPDLLELREHLWQTGAITIGGLVRLDRVLGVETYTKDTEC